ncbi:MAG: EamA family transporter [Rhodospirillales bacterium]|nr:EamA family transporter [Rhodospirillales bacterium]
MSAHRWSLPFVLGLWVLLLAFDTGSEIAFKIGSDHVAGLDFGLDWAWAVASSPWIVSGVAGQTGAFVVWLMILHRTPLSFAYPATALTYVTIMLASWLILNEEIDAWRWLGVTIIVAGVVMLGGRRRDP